MLKRISFDAASNIEAVNCSFRLVDAFKCRAKPTLNALERGVGSSYRSYASRFLSQFEGLILVPKRSGVETIAQCSIGEPEERSYVRPLS